MTRDDLRHSQRCTDPQVGDFIGLRGDHMHGCRTCKQFVVLSDTDKRPPAASAPDTAFRSSYVCRDHYHPVNPKGRGCPKCTRKTHKRKTTRRSLAADITDTDRNAT